MATDVPSTKFYNLVDPPVSVTCSQFGEVQVLLGPARIIDVTGIGGKSSDCGGWESGRPQGGRSHG